MVRQVSERRPGAWKAGLVVSIAAGALLWHLLACTESPMAFSPAGDQLALVTMEPFGGEGDTAVRGQRTYRLMIVKGARRLRTVEQTSDAILSAPAYSPDGKRLCYLRIPLFTEERIELLRERAKKFREIREEATAPGDESPATQPAKTMESEDLTLPPVEGVIKAVEGALTCGPLKAELVVRDAETDAVISVLPVELPIEDYDADTFAALYVYLRPQYSPDGQWVYVATGTVAIAFDPVARKQRFLAVAALVALLSPDGKTLAVIQEDAIGFVGTDGQKAVYRRWKVEETLSPFAIMWKDNRTLAFLEQREKGESEELWLRFLDADGTADRIKPIKLPIDEDADELPFLAMSPDGKRMAMGGVNRAVFFSADGKIVGRWSVEKAEETLVVTSPTFTPDSKQVAFKLVDMDEDGGGTLAVVFFTPDGTLLTRVNIQPVPPSPASAPATTRAGER